MFNVSAQTALTEYHADLLRAEEWCLEVEGQSDEHLTAHAIGNLVEELGQCLDTIRDSGQEIDADMYRRARSIAKGLAGYVAQTARGSFYKLTA